MVFAAKCTGTRYIRGRVYDRLSPLIQWNFLLWEVGLTDLALNTRQSFALESVYGRISS